MKLVILGFVGLLTAVASAEKQSFERYQSIIDRQMFGPLPPGFDPTKLPSEVQKSSSAQERELSKEQEQLKSAIHFSVINVAADGKTEVGFTDNSDPKTPRHYFLKVGDSRDGWTVKEADADHSLTYIASTFDPYDQVMRDGIYEGGRKIISFCGVLQQDIMPLPRLLQMSMKYGAEAMRRPVEIEFACNINDDRTADFYLLQIRPIVD